MKGKRKGKGQGKARRAYSSHKPYQGRMTAAKAAAKFVALRRLHDAAATAPAGDLADLAEIEQTTDAPPALKRQEKKRNLAL